MPADGTKAKRSPVECLSPTQNTVLGIVCGSIEVCIMQPMLYLKNASQQGLPFTADPRKLYRGLGPSVANMGLSTGLQFPLSGVAGAMLKRGEDRALRDSEKIVAGVIGGALSGLVCAPMELLMIQQQVAGRSFAETVKHIVSNTGATGMWRGLLCASAREGLYTGGYMGVGPVLTAKLQKDHGFSPTAAKMGGAIFAGTCAATLSHPFDTIKTCMQGDVTREKFTNIPGTFRVLFAEGGVQRFLNGWGWRTGRMIGAVFILSETQNLLAPQLFPSAMDA